MTKQEAKGILCLYRPETADATDASFAEALALVREDSELRAWFEAHGAVQKAIRTRFKQIPIPEGLREQIISERQASIGRQRWRRPMALVAVAALIAVVISVAVVWFRPVSSAPEIVNFDGYRNQMISTLLRQYVMTLETNNSAQIRAYLAQHQAPADYELPKALEKVALTGCGVLGWQQKRVSMVCFHSGKPLRPGERTDIFLLVAEREALPDAPAGDDPQIVKVNSLITATWTHAGKVYLLATEGDASLIRSYLN